MRTDLDQLNGEILPDRVLLSTITPMDGFQTVEDPTCNTATMPNLIAMLLGVPPAKAVSCIPAPNNGN